MHCYKPVDELQLVQGNTAPALLLLMLLLLRRRPLAGAAAAGAGGCCVYIPAILRYGIHHDVTCIITKH
jgi:hypothetical protein